MKRDYGNVDNYGRRRARSASTEANTAERGIEEIQVRKMLVFTSASCSGPGGCLARQLPSKGQPCSWFLFWGFDFVFWCAVFLFFFSFPSGLTYLPPLIISEASSFGLEFFRTEHFSSKGGHPPTSISGFPLDE